MESKVLFTVTESNSETLNLFKNSPVAFNVILRGRNIPEVHFATVFNIIQVGQIYL